MNRVEVLEELKYNIVMLNMKKELVVELSMMGERWCRGDRGIQELN